MVEVLFLGTSSMVPTKERNHTSALITYGSESILVDCGEGTQRQLKIAGISLAKITSILISHWHGDHVLGIPGLLQSMSASGYNKMLKIYGPKGTKENIRRILEVFAFKNKLMVGVKDINAGKFFSGNGFSLETAGLSHGIPSMGYSFIELERRKINLEYTKRIGLPNGPLLGKLQQGKKIRWKGKSVDPKNATILIKGKKITIINDTLPCKGAEKLAGDSDLLVCEATYASDMQSLAAEYKHMTAKQSAELARKSRVKRLVITHFSPRYSDVSILEKEAAKIFKNTSAAKDFLRIEV